MNKKRDSELAKLRKLLEDVHLESEETAHHLRQKHQAAIQEMQDQLDQVQKAKNKSDKEKQKFQAEVFELLAQLETANKEKLTAMKTVEKLEYTVHELNIKIEEINRTVIELTSQKTRLSQENTELIKEVHEHKMQLDNANHLKQQLAQQLEDTKHRLEEEERVSLMECESIRSIFIIKFDIIFFSGLLLFVLNKKKKKIRNVPVSRIMPILWKWNWNH